MPFPFGRNVVLSAISLGVFGALLAAMVIGPSNRHSVTQADCDHSYAAARTRLDTLAVDRLLMRGNGSRGNIFCGFARANRDTMPIALRPTDTTVFGPVKRR